MADEASYLSRFTLKFAEIMAAGIATAVSGYLIAHLGGFLSTTAPAPTPAAVEVAPRVVAVPKAETVSPPAAADAGALRAAPAHEAAPQAAASARTTANAAAALARKRDTSAAEAKPREKEAVEAKPRDKEAAEAKPRDKEAAESKARDKDDKESVEARVRAALANVDANRPAPAATLSRPADVPAPNATGALPPRAPDLGPQPAPQAALAPPSGQTAPIPPAPVQPAPAQADPLTSVEIKSRPVATVDETAPSSEQAAAPPEEKGLLSAIKHIFPDLRRPTPTGEPPRPPASVGDENR